MNPTLPNTQRRKILAAALKKTGQDDRLSLQELATLWGTAKSRFVNVKQEMLRDNYDFPPPEKGPKNSNLYHGLPALKVMLDYETRNDQQAHDKDQAIKLILGEAEGNENRGIMAISELALLNRESARAEERARDQGKFSTLADQAATAGRVFSRISDFFGDLDAKIDPNGQLPADIRSKLRELGNAARVKIYSDIKDVLSDEPTPSNPKRVRSAKRAN